MLVLPDPFEPKKAKTSPGKTSKSSCWTICLLPIFKLKFFTLTIGFFIWFSVAYRSYIYIFISVGVVLGLDKSREREYIR